VIWKSDSKNQYVSAKQIQIAEDAVLGRNIDVRVKGIFRLGRRSVLGDGSVIRGNNIIFGDDLYNSGHLNVGGGGRQHPTANLTMGDRCVCHNNFLNVCEPIVIGSDVGLSPEVAIITHGYWMSVLDGNPAIFSGVTIQDKVIVGFRSIILMGSTIGEGAIIGAGSVVTKDVGPYSIAAGNPAKFIRKIVPIKNIQEKISLVQKMLGKYKEIAEYHEIDPNINLEYPVIKVNQSWFNVETQEWHGNEDIEVDDFRDYARKWGFWFYGRPFKSVFSEQEE
jgi:acetyltransferase-like isoleucine patch superfamily enzyme